MLSDYVSEKKLKELENSLTEVLTPLFKELFNQNGPEPVEPSADEENTECETSLREEPSLEERVTLLEDTADALTDSSDNNEDVLDYLINKQYLFLQDLDKLRETLKDTPLIMDEEIDLHREAEILGIKIDLIDEIIDDLSRS